MTNPRYCPYFHHTIELLGRRWTGVILRVLAAEAARFGDIKGHIPGLSDRLLTSRLCELEAEGLVKRCQQDGTNHYGLTAKGFELKPAIEAVEQVAVSFARREEPADRPGRIRSA